MSVDPPTAPASPVPAPTVSCTALPDLDTLRRFAQQGGSCVVDLCRDDEHGASWDEATAVQALGMDYVQIPVPGSTGLTHWAAHALAVTLARHRQRPVLVHCTSGQRAAALLALKHAWVDGASPEQALRTGRQAGLDAMEPTVRTLLDA